MLQGYRTPPDAHQVLLPFDGESPFNKWAKLYFKKHRLNCFIPISEAFESFIQETKAPYTRLQFRKALTVWCHNKKYELDPKDLQNSAGRIIRKREIALGKFVATEMLFIKTKK